MTNDERITALEKEVADLKRQIEERPKNHNEQLFTLTAKQAFCAAKHLQAFLQLTVNEDQYFILPCRVCKYVLNKNCDCGINRNELMDYISKQTGVNLSFFKGFRTEQLPEGLQR